MAAVALAANVSSFWFPFYVIIFYLPNMKITKMYLKCVILFSLNFVLNIDDNHSRKKHYIKTKINCSPTIFLIWELGNQHCISVPCYWNGSFFYSTLLISKILHTTVTIVKFVLTVLSPFERSTFHSLVNVRDSDFLREGIQVLWSYSCLLLFPIPALSSILAVCWISSGLFWSFDYRFSVIFGDATTILNCQRSC